jgi:hypothetical protein
MKNVEIKHLQYVVALAEELSFSKAALRISIAQPHLSREIQKLEKELGYKLFERNNRNVLLTQQGASFVRNSRKVLEAMHKTLSIPKKDGRPIEIMYNDISLPLNVSDEFGWLIGANEAWIKYWKVVDLVQPRKFNVLHDEQIPEEIRCHLQVVFKDKKYALIEDLYFDPQKSAQIGIPRQLSLMIFPMLDERKNFKHFVNIHIDKSESYQIRSELKRLREENVAMRQKLAELYKRGKSSG